MFLSFGFDIVSSDGFVKFRARAETAPIPSELAPVTGNHGEVRRMAANQRTGDLQTSTGG